MKTTANDNHIQIKAYLYHIKPEIWRRFTVPLDFTFAALHDAIQVAMGWENKHPHEFRHGKNPRKLVDVIGPVGLQDQTPGEFLDETQVSVADFLGRRKLPVRILYRYDFTDEWIHEIAFEKRVAGGPLPVLLEGARACPPEDEGGAFPYMRALHGEIQWLKRGYDPEAFDPAKVDFTPRKKRKA